jgi:hypothetical protein
MAFRENIEPGDAREEADNFLPFRGLRERNENVWAAYDGKAAQFSTNKKGSLPF